ncbi:hypothetical protein V8F20_004788 [Naviculisporaceae sp. PSN 640]
MSSPDNTWECSNCGRRNGTAVCHNCGRITLPFPEPYHPPSNPQTWRAPPIWEVFPGQSFHPPYPHPHSPPGPPPPSQTTCTTSSIQSGPYQRATHTRPVSHQTYTPTRPAYYQAYTPTRPATHQGHTPTGTANDQGHTPTQQALHQAYASTPPAPHAGYTPTREERRWQDDRYLYQAPQPCQPRPSFGPPTYEQIYASASESRVPRVEGGYQVNHPSAPYARELGVPNIRVPAWDRPRQGPRRSRSASPRGYYPSNSSSQREFYRDRSPPPPARFPRAFPTMPENRPPRPLSPAAVALPETPEGRLRRSQSPWPPSPYSPTGLRQNQPPRPPLRPAPRPSWDAYAKWVDSDHERFRKLGYRYNRTKTSCDECEKRHAGCDCNQDPNQCDNCLKRGVPCLFGGRPKQRRGPRDMPPGHRDPGYHRRDDDDEGDHDRRGQGGGHYRIVNNYQGPVYVN